MQEKLVAGMELTGEHVRGRLKACHATVNLNMFCKICKPETVEIGEHTRVCDFVFIWGGISSKIGRYVDMQPHVTIWGGGEIVIGDYVSVGVSTVLLTAGYSYKEGLRMVDGRPDNETLAQYGKLIIEDDVYIGASCTLLSNITIGKGSIIGANSLVNKDTEPFGIYVGSPAKKIGVRPPLTV